MEPISQNQTGDQPSGDREEIFYNVMHRESHGAQIRPILPVEPVEPAAPPVVGSFSESTGRFNPKKIAIISGAVIIVLAAAFGAYLLLGKKKQPASNASNIAVNSNVNNGAAQEGVSTPVDWQKRYFGNERCQDLAICGDSADPDHDGLTNVEEYGYKTDPNNPDSDSDGLADGDEVHAFGSSPLTGRTYSSGQYNDADFVKGGYDTTTNEKFTPEKLTDIKSKIAQSGLHQPTISTLGTDALAQYGFVDTSLNTKDSSSVDPTLDQSPSAKLERDTQRSDTIKKIGGALLKYQNDKAAFPDTTDFSAMTDAIKPYITVATNYSDPINKGKYVYSYTTLNKAQDFTLSYYSETQDQIIKYTAQQASIDQTKSNAAANDNQRIHDVEKIAQALGIYSDSHTDPNSGQDHVFPAEDQYKAALIPQYLTAIPTDPVTKKDYLYNVGDKFDTFTLRAVLDNPAKGTTGYMCNQVECKNY